MAPGSRWISREREEGHVFRVSVTVTRRTRVVASGIRARVVHDIVTEKGRVVENTYDWYAQDRAGNVWYLGEDTKAYEPGKPVSTQGSWEDGVDGARRGIAMPAHPRVGMSYRQEYYRGKAEDRGRVLSLDKRATVPFGTFNHLLQTRDYTRLEPDATEHKYYAQGAWAPSSRWPSRRRAAGARGFRARELSPPSHPVHVPPLRNRGSAANARRSAHDRRRRI